MPRRTYYSIRSGKHLTGGGYDLALLKRLFLALYGDLVEQERFQELLGKDCVDDPDLVGTAGRDIQAFFLRKLKKDNLWPIADRIGEYTEDDLFDVIELLHDHVSVGVDGYMHSYAGCGMHYETFDAFGGRSEYRTAVNELLAEYSTGFELNSAGEIVRTPESGFESLIRADLPHSDFANVTKRVNAAVQKYQARASTLDDRREAVRSLIDVLEYLRPQLKEVFAAKDEADLFNIANNFGLRHHNDRQRTDYDPNIWTSWMFYFYLATVHAGIRLLERIKAE